MAQEITVGLRFTADTAQARQQLNSLKQDLMGLNSLTVNQGGFKFTKDISEASIAAAKLKTQLDAATNVKTGNLDLTKFAKSLKQSGTSLEYYRQQLQSLGPDGQQAFMQLANSIQSAEVPLIRVNRLFSSLWDSLKRTAKWQFSSSAIHALMGAVQGAYRYAQDLNESLNNIRIVTGQSTEQMARFAEQANRSAKALSTTTTAYTDAALIYYQQGLSDQEVKERTDVTMKMANVTRESAETVSQQMTAVWNNFAKGGESLELFADKMTALGAATASSSAEISQGLEKFAGVADTIGLSFDYAAAALTTITATTRMSAETVGTALKTLFSRLESLKLGESLEDGTDLTKYSAALAAVGVNIKDSNGELKQMDQILDETMDKWKTLSKDQQVALAQTVAGQRQYTQFVTLMENSDFFKKNLATEAGAAGTLEEQQEIYAESWEGARDRVQAALESIYQHLLDDDFFISITDGLSKILGFVDKLIQSLGGMPGILATISTLVLRLAGDSVAQKIRDMAFSFQTIISHAKNVSNIKNEAVNQSNKMINALGKFADPDVQNQAYMYNHLNTLQQELTKNAHKMTDEEISQKNALIEIQRLREEENLTVQKNANQLAKNIDLIKEEAGAASLAATREQDQINQNFEKNQTRLKFINSQKGGYSKKLKYIQKEPDEAKEHFQQRKQELENKIIEITKEQEQLHEIIELFKTSNAEDIEKYVDNVEEEIDSRLIQQHNIEEALSEYKLILEEQKNLSSDSSETQQAKINEEVTLSFNKLLEAVKAYDNGLANDMSLEKDNAYNKAVAKEAINNLSDEIEDCIINEEKELKTLGVSEKTIKRLISAHRAMAQAKQAESKASIDAARVNKITEQSYKLILNNLKEAKMGIKDYANAITSAARTISSVVAGVSSFIGALKAFENPDLSSWEKFSTLMMSLPMMLGGLTEIGMSAVKTFNSITNAGRATYGVLEGLSQAQQTYNAISNLSIDSLGAAKDVILSKDAAEKLHGQTLDSLLGKEGKQLIAAELKTEQERKEKEAIIAKIIAERTDLNETEALGPAKLIVAKAEDTHTASIWKNIAAQIAQHWYILAIVAALAVLGAAIYAVIKAENAEAESTKAAQERLENTQKSLEETKNRYDALKTAISELKDSRKTLDGLKEGTAEWREQVILLNQQVLDLIDKWPILSQFLTNDNGILGFKEGGLEFAQWLQMQGLAIGQRISMSQQKANYTDTIADDQLSQLANDFAVIHKEIYSTVKDLDMFDDVSWSDSKTVKEYFEKAINNQYGYDTLKVWFDGLTESTKIESQQKDALFNILNAVLDIQKDREEFPYESQWKKEQLASTTPEQRQLVNAMVNQRLNNNVGSGSYFNELFNTYAPSDSTITTKELYENVKNLDWIESLKIKDGSASQNLLDQMAEDYANMLNGQSDGYTYEADQTDGAAFRIRRKKNGDTSYDKEYTQSLNYSKIADELAYYKNVIQDEDIDAANELINQINSENIQNYLNGKINYEEFADSVSAAIGEENQGLLNNVITALGSEVSSKYFGDENIQPLVDQVVKSIQITSADRREGISKEDVADSVRQQIQDIKNNLSDEDLTIFASFEFDPNKSGNLEEQWNRYKEQEEEKLNVSAISKNAQLYEIDEADLGEMAKVFDEMNEELVENGQLLADDSEAAADAATRYTRLNRAVEDLYKNFNDYDEVLNEIKNSSSAADKQAQRNTTTYKNFKKSLADLLNTSEDLMDSDFIESISSDDLENAAMGQAEAIENIRNAYLDSSAAAVGYAGDLDAVKEELANMSEGQVVDFSNMDSALAAFIDQFITLGVEAGWTLGDIETRLQAITGLDLSLDTVPILNNLDEISNKAAETGDHIVQDLSYDVETTTNDQQNQSTYEDIGFTETFTNNPAHQVTSDVLEVMNNGTTATKPVTANYIGVTKTVNTNPIQETANSNVQTTAVKVKNAHKSAGGNVSKKNQSSASPRKSGGGGGGGGGGSKRTAKKPSQETERYHEVNEKLDDVSNKLDRLGKVKDRAFGGKHVAAIQAEIEALKEESKLLDEKFKETEKYFNQDAAALNAYGAIYDSAGRITNYNKIIEDSVAKYNAGTIDDEEYEHIKDALSKYEESLNQMEDLTEERAENARKILDAQFEKVEYSIEIKLKINDETNKILDWQMSQLEDQKFASVERINLFDQQVAAANARWMSYMGGINDILKAAGATQEQIEQYLSGDVEAIANLDNLTQQAIDDLGKYVDGLREEQLKLLELQRSIYEELNNLQDEYNNKFENMLSNYEDASTELEFLQNAIDTMGKETAGISNDLLSSLRRGQIEIQYGNIKSLQSQLAMNEAFLKDTQEKLKTATDNERAQLEEMEQTLLDKVSDIKGNIYSEANELMKGLKEDFEANVDAMFEEFEKELSGAFDSFEELRDQFDQARTLREEYIPEYQKLYELAKLTRQINNDIDNTDSVKNKEKLRELQEEITALQADGVELSEYDLKNMQNKYDLRLAEIALEEAQNVKSTVRLTRDSMGNYSYVYTANERNIDEAEQKYEDALYKMQDENEQYLTELSDLYLQIQTEMNEKLIEAAKSGKTNEELNMIKDYYAQRLEYVNSQMNNALGNNTDLYNNDLQAYRNSLRGKIIENKAFTKDFKSTLLGGVLDTYSTLDQYNQDLLGKLGDPTSGTGMLGKISASITELNASYETILSQVTGSTVKLGETIGTIYGANGQVITSFADLTKDSLTDVLAETQNTIDKTKEFGEEAKIGYQKAANEVSKASNEIIQKLNQMTAETVKAQLAHELLLKTLERKIVDPNNVVTTTQVNITKNVTSFESTGSSGGSSGGGGGTYSGSTSDTTSNSNSLNPLATIQQAGSKLGQQFGQVLETYDSMNLATWNREMADVKKSTKQPGYQHNDLEHWQIYTDGTEVKGSRKSHSWGKISGTNIYVHMKCTVCNYDHYFYYTEQIKPKQHGAFFKAGNDSLRFLSYDTEAQAKNVPNMVKYYDTGGYTGAWGSEGKLAMLHEKELVLNKQDTQNMLATVDFVRSLSSMIDLQGLAQSFGQLATLPQVANNLSNSNSNVSQEIHIDASFPGVTAREEIEQAFSDLALQASQYINR